MNEPILEMKHLTMGFGGLELFFSFLFRIRINNLSVT